MNKIEIKRHLAPCGYMLDVFFIDDKPLYEYFNECSKNIGLDDFEISCLEICWGADYDFEGDALFEKYILDKGTAITPILSCPEDLDFSCTVIVADVVYKDDVVCWKRIGLVDHSGENWDDQARYGILFTKKMTEKEFNAWYPKHWTEELFLRRVNYTYPYYQNENNIEWFADCNFVFDQKQYDALVDSRYPAKK